MKNSVEFDLCEVVAVLKVKLQRKRCLRLGMDEKGFYGRGLKEMKICKVHVSIVYSEDINRPKTVLAVK